MTDEEAKERIKVLIEAGEEYFKAFGGCFITEDELEAIQKQYKRIKELENALIDNNYKHIKEKENKDKVINDMEDWIFNKDYTENSLLIHRDDYHSNCIKQVIEYYEKKEEV